MSRVRNITDKLSRLLFVWIKDHPIAFPVSRDRNEILQQLASDIAGGRVIIQLDGKTKDAHVCGNMHGHSFWVSASPRYLRWINFHRTREFGSKEFSQDYLTGTLRFMPLWRGPAILAVMAFALFTVLSFVLAIWFLLLGDGTTIHDKSALLLMPVGGLGLLILSRLMFGFWLDLSSFSERYTVAYVSQLVSK